MNYTNKVVHTCACLIFGRRKYHNHCISPGWIQTTDYEELREQDHRQHPSRRVGKPADVARTCLFLTEEQNDFINGENIILDGGMTKKMMYIE